MMRDVDLQIIASESLSEATKYVSEFGDKRESDNEEEWIDSRFLEIVMKEMSKYIIPFS